MADADGEISGMDYAAYVRDDFEVTLFERDGVWWVRGEVPEVEVRVEEELQLSYLSTVLGYLAGEVPAELPQYVEHRSGRPYRRPRKLMSEAAPDSRLGQSLLLLLLTGRVLLLFIKWRRHSTELRQIGADPLYTTRLLLRIAIPALAALPWELMAASRSDLLDMVVRATTNSVPAARSRLRMPVQVTQVELHARRGAPHDAVVDVRKAIREVFRSPYTGRVSRRKGKIFRVARLSARIPGVLAKQLGRKTDVLHLSNVVCTLSSSPGPMPAWIPIRDRGLRAALGRWRIEHSQGGEEPLSYVTTDDFVAYLRTVGVRLLVLQTSAADPVSFYGCMQFGQTVVDRGGPPVLVTRLASRPDGSRIFYETFYERIVHDAPLDIARRQAEEASRQHGQTALVVRPGDEEILRLSSLLPRAYHLHTQAMARAWHLRSSMERLGARAATTWPGAARESLSKLFESLDMAERRLRDTSIHPNWAHESRSSLPLVEGMRIASDTIGEMDRLEARLAHVSRQVTGQQARPREERDEGDEGDEGDKRYVNTWLLNPQTGQQQPKEAPLAHGTLYELHIDIGPRALESTVVNATEIPPTAVQELIDRGGDWLNVAVYSQDFSVRDVDWAETNLHNWDGRGGVVTRLLWLPASGPSAPLRFHVTPTWFGLTYLRICIYYHNQLLQSLRLDARVLIGSGDGQLDVLPGISTAQVGQLKSMGLSTLADVVSAGVRSLMDIQVPRAQAATWVKAARRLPELGYETLIEYTISSDFKDLSKHCQPAATIFTNNVNGSQMIGVKIDEWDETWGAGNDWTSSFSFSEQALAARSGDIRTRLDVTGIVEVAGIPRYRFEDQNDPSKEPPIIPNQGKEEQLREALVELACLGRRLYNDMFPRGETRQKLNKVLATPEQSIHIARVAEGEVLPWACVYNYPLDPAAPDLQVCLEPLNNVEDGRMVYHPCEAGRGICPLNASNRRQVVCPWGFWGFKHILEQPAQRVEESAAPRDLATEISALGAAKACMSVDATLELLDDHYAHLSKLRGITKPLEYAGDDRVLNGQTPDKSGRTQVLEALAKSDLNIIYFYCHAGTISNGGDWPEPYLSVGIGEERIIPDSLRDDEHPYQWPQHPLVFINGCESVAIDPTVMDGFIQCFADLGAAGVIGTEVRVHEVLASNFAEWFLSAFLEGHKVGAILHDLRHKLLLLRNPLGLVYTNYCSADLHLKGQKPTG